MLREYEVPMDDEVAVRLKKASKTTLFSKESLKLIGELVPLGGATLALVLVLLWIFVNWLLGFIIAFDFGWNSQYRNYILWSIVGFSYSLILYEVAKSCGPNSKIRQAIEKDLAESILKVSEYPVYEVKVFEEPEHGGFIYFVRTFGDKVLALFDSESQDLSIDGKEPKNSTYKIRKKLQIFRAPNSNIIVKEQFDGDFVEIPEMELFTGNTKIWPEHAGFVKCKWTNISVKYGDKSKQKNNKKR